MSPFQNNTGGVERQSKKKNLLIVEKNITTKPQNIGILYPILFVNGLYSLKRDRDTQKQVKMLNRYFYLLNLL